MNIIYQITNSVNNKIYIGQTWYSLEQRFIAHKSSNNKVCRKLHNAFNKYGRENFAISEICQTDNQEDADSLEIFLIKSRDTIKNGYNLREGGSHGKHTEESKIKMKGYKNRLGHKVSEETKNKMSKPKTEEHKKNMSKAHRGKILTNEHRSKISKALIGNRNGLKNKKRIG